jgi:hypothetical protein
MKRLALMTVVLACAITSSTSASAPRLHVVVKSPRPVARIATVPQAEYVFKSYMRRFCGNGAGVCITMNPAYCTNVGGYLYACNTTWLETSTFGFRRQWGSGHVYNDWVRDYEYHTI